MRVRKLLAQLSGGLAITAMVAGSAWGASTPIEHVVVIFQENVSFDHYFATYPVAKNTDGTSFSAKAGTPSVNGLSGSLLSNNPNFNGTFGAPFRLSHAQAASCDQDHDYTDEQKAFDLGMMDLFPSEVNVGACGTINSYDGSLGHPNDLVMGYYDGNTTTALWNYAQNFAMNDDSFSTTFGPSTPGAINLISGNTSGAVQDAPPNGFVDITAGSMTSDAQPFGDTCTTRDSAHMTGKNIGDPLNAASITWGWFEGGFDITPSLKNPNGSSGCGRTHSSITNAFSPKVDYIPHHEPFQYYASTANPTHKRPTGAIGSTDQANHQYDSKDFFDALAAGNLPSVVFLKAPGYQDGHAGYSSPLDEQTFFVDTINQLEKSKFWSSTAVIIAYDDSDGWYDHVMSPIIMHSQQSTDALTGTGQCGSASTGLQGQGRCGFGPRQPFLVISPWAKTNFVDSTLTDLSSIIAFIEDDFGLARIGGTQTSGGSFVGSTDQFAGSLLNMFDFNQKKGQVNGHKVYLDPTTGAVLKKAPKDLGGDQP